jgi:hypothetical protein
VRLAETHVTSATPERVSAARGTASLAAEAESTTTIPSISSSWVATDTKAALSSTVNQVTAMRSRWHQVTLAASKLARSFRQRDSASQHHGEFSARADPQRREDLAEVVLDRPRTEEEASSNHGVREPFSGETRDLRLLRRQVATRLDASPTGGCAGRAQFALGPFGEPVEPMFTSSS